MSRESATARRRLPAAERRELIIEAAGRAFGDRGYEGARLDEIAGAAGVTKPILYRHFDSKQELYLALLDRHRDDLPTFGERMPTEGSPSERLRAVLELWLDYVESHSYAWQMIFRDTGGGVPIEARRRELNARAREVLAAIIRELGPAIPLREVRPLAELMSMGMASVVLWWMETPGVSRGAVLDALTRAWSALLSSHGIRE
jgi:AcrR family transcriptional regulator